MGWKFLSLLQQATQSKTTIGQGQKAIPQNSWIDGHMTTAAENLKVHKIILRLSALYKSRCRICHMHCETGKYFAIHHIKYVKKEKTHRDFKDKETGQYFRLKYYRYLAPIVKKNPKRFALVCWKCHTLITRWGYIGKDKRKRITKLVNESDK